ncbi:MAG: hypothetical protein J6M63_09770 [Pseudobutyrivibrio sp.]|uniref:hypothetical protein n=1 Tax=Pseudobutyrivibrio sp. TaxID=2014367 RepID=UPI001B160E6D|nr:hypothetical protein [Pseudobutyrivibrio sp.]MBO6284201.1 hypothetical protein [Pseudobutyrivibrio sp.]MBP3263072.1 hypothetical protein [Pseudobutyrivibrio sp.]
MLNQLIDEISIESLQNSELGMNFSKIIHTYEKIQEILQARLNDTSPDNYKDTRIGTVIIFAILSKLTKGKNIRAFSKDDWADIAEAVSQYAIFRDGQEYSIIIFNLYADYIDASVDYLKRLGVSKEKCAAVSMIAEQVRNLSENMMSNIISEIDYTEACLWLLLEAMIKLLSTYSTLLIGEGKAEYLDIVSNLAFEYGRYILYKKEQEIITLYINNQYQLDEILSNKLEEYRKDLKKQSEQFDSLIANAFSPNINDRLKSSSQLAINAGVSSNEVLTNQEQIDDYFL